MELNPQAVIDEMSKRIHALTLENIVLNSQIAQLKAMVEAPTQAEPAEVTETA